MGGPAPAPAARRAVRRLLCDVDEAVLASIPRSYVVTKHDNAMMPALQRRMIREHPCASVVELDADHAPFLSATDELVAALAALAEDASQSQAPVA